MNALRLFFSAAAVALLLGGMPLTTFAQTNATPATRFVSTTGTNADPTSATSWATSTTDLQGAINSLSVTGGEVWVAQGIYKPGGNSNIDRTVSFSILSGVQVYGGFVGTETALNQRPTINLTIGASTTLSGEIGDPASTTDNSYHVVWFFRVNTQTRLDGVVITGGNANDPTFPNNIGGGIYNEGSGTGNSSNPTLANCFFQNNQSLSDGGAVYNNGATGGNASPTLTNCAFLNNRATGNGGGIYNGGGASGVSSPTLTNCVFQSNSATSSGGAMVNNGNFGNSSPVLTRCLFQLNTTNNSGGALFNVGDGGNSSPTLINCVFQNNRALVNGGAMVNRGVSSGISRPVLTNCSFGSNSAASGGVMFNNGTSSGVSSPTLTNCVVWDNGGASTFGNNAATGVVATYSLFDNTATSYTATNSLTVTVSPFASTTSLQLAATSPAINAGNPATTSATVGTIDLAGNPRFNNSRIDLGAYEFQAPPPARLFVQAGATGTNNGLSWANAFTDLQSALTYPSSQSLTEIWVAAGTYKPAVTNRTASFTIPSGVRVYGGFVGTETDLSQRPTINPTTGTAQPYATILSGEIGNPTSTTDNSIHVVRFVRVSTQTRLDGFVIMGGNANITGSFNNVGGGIYNDGSGAGNSSNPTIANCLLQNNAASINGGAMSNNGSLSGNSSPVLTNCLLQNNIALDGGGIYNEGGGGTSSPVLTNCAFQSNTATGNGGAMYNRGAAVSNINGNSSPVLTNCSFGSNTAVTNGCALYNNGNNAGGSSNPVLTNCVVWGNGGTKTFFNSSAASVLASYSLFDNTVTSYTATNSLTASTSPFASTASLQLAAGSPATNAGAPTTTSAIVGQTDLAGNLRFFGSRIDMGAYESQCASTTPVTRLYVRPSITANANQTGLSWDDAFPNLQQALTYSCSQHLVEIWVAAGTYKPALTTDRTASFVLPNGLALYGGFPNSGNPTMAQRDPVANPTILSGDIDGVADGMSGSGSSLTITGNAGNSLHVVRTTNLANALLDGFVITGGNANLGTGNDQRGGGLLNLAGDPGKTSSLTISNCVFRGNSANLDGGGLYSTETNGGISKLELTSCTIAQNIAVTSGGTGGAGAYLLGGSTGSNRLSRCLVHGNRASVGFGGGVSSDSPLWLDRCMIRENFAANGGGLDQSGDLLTMTNSWVQSNSTTFQSSGINLQDCPEANLTNCEISGNVSQNSQGGIANTNYARNTRLNLINCTVANNTSRGIFRAVWTESFSSSITATTTLKNTIVANNPNGNFLQSNVQSILQSLGNNLDSDGTSSFTNTALGDLLNVNPGFVSATDLRLQTTSPAIDAGDPATTSVAIGQTDLAGNPRFVNTLVDMGAYEQQTITLIFSLRDGLWNDPTLWSVGRLPLSTERVRLKHAVTLPTNFTGQSGVLIYAPNSRLIYQTGGRLQMGQ